MSDPTSTPAVTRVREALDRLGVPDRIRVLDAEARTAGQAASALGVDVGQIASSLVFRVAGTPAASADLSDGASVLVLTSGAHRVDQRKVADLLGVPALALASPEAVSSTTGFRVGGVAPVGHLTPVATYVDVSLSRFDTVWAAAGDPSAVFATSYDELVRITGGQGIEVV